jgi:predicted dehydrogenase
MVEKPLATTRLDLDYLKDALGKAKEQDLVISSCHARRFDPPFLWLKSMLGQTKIALGEVMGVDYDFSYAKLRKTGLHE